MRFLRPDVLWHLLWLVPLMIVVFVVSGQKTAVVLKAFLGKHAEDPEYVPISRGKRLFRFFLLLLTVVFLIGAAARPSWGVQIQEMHGQGRDLLFVFDTSRSMLAKDVQPSRLAHAKWLVRELVKQNPGDRFGLIAFAGRAFLECPLTSDKTSFLQAVDELSTTSIPVGGTNIQAALETALQAFKAAETQHRAVVLITDGDELEGDSGKAVDEIIARKIPLFIAGIGDPAQPSIIQIPDGRGGLKTLKDAQGNIVNSPLNEASLGSLAKRTGGIYVRSTAGDPRLSALEKRIRALAPQDYESVKTTKPIDRFGYPLAIAFVLMLIWFTLSDRAVRTGGAAAAVFLCAFSMLPVQAQTPQDKGQALPQNPPVSSPADPRAPEGGTAVAENASGENEPVDPVKLFNRGVDAQQQGKLPEAVKQYESALANGVDNMDLRGRVSQNLGVITHTRARSEFGASLQALQQQNLDEAQKKVESSLKVMNQAEEMYRESMRESTEHSGIAKNQSVLLADRQKAETLKKKIDELKKMQQQAQKQTRQAKNQQQKENQQKQNQQNQQGQDRQKQDQQGQDRQKQDQQNQQGQDRQKQDQQNQQGQQGQDRQKQDQQNQQGQDRQKQDQQSAQQKTEEAGKSAEELQKKARELGQKQMEQSARQAKQELDKAREEQRKGNGKSAEEHLNKALEKLGGDPDRKQDPQKQDSKDGKESENQKDNADQKQDNSGKQNQPEPSQAQSPRQEEPEEGEIDKSQAAALLQDMAKDEKNLRDAIKARQKQHYRNVVPARDW